MKSFALVITLILTLPLLAEEPTATWNPEVLRLFVLAERDHALQKVLSAGLYPDKPAYRETTAGQIKEVVLCPQPGGLPLVTVFAHSEHDDAEVSARSGHLIVIRSDGMILPFYHGANSLDGHFEDVNTDGVIDYIDSWGMGFADGQVTSLHVVPITERFTPSLVIYWKHKLFTWRLHQPGKRVNPIIQIGTSTNDIFTPVAEYRWSRELCRWVGPAGSPQEKFMVVDGDGKDTARKLLDKSVP